MTVRAVPAEEGDGRTTGAPEGIDVRADEIFGDELMMGEVVNPWAYEWLAAAAVAGGRVNVDDGERPKEPLEPGYRPPEDGTRRPASLTPTARRFGLAAARPAAWPRIDDVTGVLRVCVEKGAANEDAFGSGDA
jgi:hypothetical protein